MQTTCLACNRVGFLALSSLASLRQAGAEIEAGTADGSEQTGVERSQSTYAIERKSNQKLGVGSGAGRCCIAVWSGVDEFYLWFRAKKLIQCWI